MEATRFSFYHFHHPHNFTPKPKAFPGRRHAKTVNGIRTRVSYFTLPTLTTTNSHSLNRIISVNFSDRLRSDYTHVETPLLTEEVVPETRRDDGEAIVASPSGDNSLALEFKPTTFQNRFMNFMRFGSVINGAAESVFKSEIRRRLFVTAVLIVISRVGYFIPLPGFDRRLIPKDYMSFVSGSSVASGR